MYPDRPGLGVGLAGRIRSDQGPDPAGLTVWIDDEHIRQVRYEELMEHVSRTTTLELWDFGVPVDSLDWSRLPSFRTPG